ncbi:MAG: hypothetical protein HQL56_10770 [Magnetococcales bacterium]|nr:hypothetical protein [Magnetococcales bacterium]
MMHSYEAEVSADGQVRLREPMVLRGRHRAVLTVLEPLESDEVASDAMEALPNWRRFAGVMKESPHFNGDPVSIQRAMRDEWD